MISEEGRFPPVDLFFFPRFVYWKAKHSDKDRVKRKEFSNAPNGALRRRRFTLVIDVWESPCCCGPRIPTLYARAEEAGTGNDEPKKTTRP